MTTLIFKYIRYNVMILVNLIFNYIKYNVLLWIQHLYFFKRAILHVMYLHETFFLGVPQMFQIFNVLFFVLKIFSILFKIQISAQI